MPYTFHVTVFSLCWNHLVYYLITFCPKNILPCAKYGLCPAPACMLSQTSQTRSRQRLLPATVMCCRFLGCQHCLQPLFLRCSCDLLKGDLGQYSAGRPNRRHSTSCMDKINSSPLCCFQTGSEVHLAFSPLGTRNIFLGGKGNRSW